MQRVKFFNTSSILNVIPIEKLTSDVGKMPSNLSFQIDRLFPKSFFANIKFIFFQSNNSIQIGFNVSTYEKVVLFQMYSKPILFNEKPFVYNFDTLYVSKNPQLTLFTKTTYKENCFYSSNLKRVFCKNASPIRDCDRKILLNEKVDIYSECFNKLPITNYVTQINNNLYFTLRAPLELNITCANDTKTLLFEQSSNILGIFNCTLKSDDFILHTNSYIEHKITAIPTHEHKDKYLLLYYFHMGMLCFVLIPNMLFMAILIIRERNIPDSDNNNNNTNTVTYAAFDTNPYNYDSLPPQYRESLI